MSTCPRPARHLVVAMAIGLAGACTGPTVDPTAAPASATPGGTSRSATPPAAQPSPGPTSPTVTPTPPSPSPPPDVRTTPPDDAPTFDGAGSLVVTSADGVVSRVAPTDGEVVPLGGVTGATQVTPSADGATLVFTQLDDGDPVIAVRTDAASTRVPVATAPYFHLVSPEGSRVASLGNSPDGSAVSLLITELAGGSSTEIDRGRPYFLSWRNDGQQLAANIDATVLATVDVTGTRSPLAVTPGSFQAPVWTDDDRLVVVLASADAVPVGARGAPTGPRPAWWPERPSPGSTAGSLVQAVNGTLAVVDPTDATTTRVVEVTGAVSFDVAGDRVAWVAGTSRQAASLGPLEVIGLDGTGHTRLSEVDVAMFEWSPDGERLLFQVVDPDRGLVPHVWDGTTVTAYDPWIPTTTLATQYLPFWPQYALAITQWAPDGSAFAHVTAGADGEPGTVVVQALDGTRNEVAPGEMVIWTR